MRRYGFERIETTMFKRLLNVLALGTALSFASFAHAQLEIKITSGNIEPRIIALVPFGWNGAGPSPYDVAEVVEADLVSSGRFEAIPRGIMRGAPTTGEQVDLSLWGRQGAEFVVIGQIRPMSGDNYEINFQAFNVALKKQILAYQLTAPLGKMRAASHYISDLVYESIEGVRGIFSTRIAYVTVTDNRAYELVVADADGENPKTIVRSAEPIMSPAWSPDGKELAYVVFEEHGSAIYIKNIYTGQSRRVSARPGVNGAPSFSPDGRSLALTLSDQRGNLDIHVLNLVSGDLKRITRDSAIDTEPAWSADGQKLFFSSDRSGGPQIYEVSATGGPALRLSFEGNYNARPRLAPDGKTLSVVHNDKGNYRIGVLDLNTGGMVLVSDGNLDESPSFAPNGQVLIYAATLGRRGGLATVSTDGQIRKELSSAGNDVREPVWSPFPK